MTDRSGRAARYLAGSVVAAALMAGLFHLARSRTIQLCGRIVARVQTSERVVALTFDDGPNAAHVDGILTQLEDAGVHATFFVTGGDMEAAPELGRRIVAAGHELGNHTYSHVRMVLRSQGFIRSEIERTDRLIRDAGERGEIFFRPPYSWKLVGLPWFLWRTGRTTVTFDVEPDSYPAVAATPEGITAYVRQHVRPGSVVLLHVWWGGPGSRGASCLAAIPMIIRTLRDDGYRFVTVRELMRSGPV
jgi:peptidoglycan-N-acetylglucosamine deacetylase